MCCDILNVWYGWIVTHTAYIDGGLLLLRSLVVEGMLLGLLVCGHSDYEGFWAWRMAMVEVLRSPP